MRTPDARTRMGRRWKPVAGALTLALASGVTAVALASSGTTMTVGSASNTKLKEVVVVNRAGHTLYALSPETSKHLLCKSSTCLSVWPPLTVRNKHVKLKDGSGVHGTLALLHRSNGAWQVTLRGKPLYRFSGDGGKAEANGEGLKSFGGTWHAVTGSTAATQPTQTTPTTPTTPEYPEYHY